MKRVEEPELYEPHLNGEHADVSWHIIIDRFKQAFENAHKLKASGSELFTNIRTNRDHDLSAADHEVFTNLANRDGKVELTPDNHILTPHDEPGHFLLHLVEAVDIPDQAGNSHKKIIASTVVIGAAVLACAKAINQRNHKNT